jgi:hypothetical protein
MRAFVTSATVDLDPVSEVAVRLILEQASAPGTSFTNFTLAEVNDFSAAVRLLAMSKHLASGADLDTTIATIRTAVLSQAGIMAFMRAAMTEGETTQGPGDVGNYFPYAQGNVWNFQRTHTESGQVTSMLQHTVTVNGTILIGGITAVKFLSESDANASGEEYLTNDSTGITFHGNSSPDSVTTQLVPYKILRFPLQTGASFQALHKTGINVSEDFDRDGKNETVDVTSDVTVVSFGPATVPAGSFMNAAQIKSVRNITVVLSASGTRITGSSTLTFWLAPGIGPIKRQVVTQVPGGTATTLDELVSFVVDGQGTGAVPLTIATAVSQANSDTTDPGPSGIGSDGTKYLVVFCKDWQVSPGLYGVLITNGVDGQPFPIAPRACSSNNGIGVGFDGTNYLVVFSQNALIRGVRVTKFGDVLDGSDGFAISTGIPSSATNYQPTIAFDGTSYLVVWQKFGGDYDIYGARVTPNGQVLGEFPIFTASGEQIGPSVVFDGTNYLVVWQDTRSGSGPTDSTDIYGTRVSPAGTVLDPSGIAITTAFGYQGQPSIAFDGTNHFVVWSDVQQLGFSPPSSGIYGKRVSPNGFVLDGPADSRGISINTTSFGKSAPTVAFNGTSYLVAWVVGAFTNNPPVGIYGAKVSTGGQVVDGQPDSLGKLLNGPPESFDAKFAYPIAHSNQSSTLLTWINNRELGGTTKSILGLLIFP